MDAVDLRILTRLQRQCAMLEGEQTNIWATLSNLPGWNNITWLREQVLLSQTHIAALTSRIGVSITSHIHVIKHNCKPHQKHWRGSYKK